MSLPWPGRQALSLESKIDCSEAWVHGLLPKCDPHLHASPPASGKEGSEMGAIPVPRSHSVCDLMYL